MKLATAGEMAAVDRCASELHGVPVSLLMERAGSRAAAAAQLLLPTAGDRRVAILCGRGNNGGDGLVAARLLREGGAAVRAILVGERSGLRPDARDAWEATLAAGVETSVCTSADEIAALRVSLREVDLVVDALLGTGFTPPARGLVLQAIGLINSLGRPVLALDLPSGLAADDGRVNGEAVRATATVTFGYPKPCLVLHPAAQHVGRLWLADIGLPPAADALVAGDLRLTTARDLRLHLAPRDPESHKGTFGHVLLVAGSCGMAGAAVLAARGALRSGAGVVTVCLPAAIAPAFLPDLPEAMLLSLPDVADPAGVRAAAALLAQQFPRASALALGPGLSRSEGAAQLVRALCAAAELPLLLDADALHALAAAGPPLIARRAAPAVLTPHPGELSRLMGTSTERVQADRIGAARACAARYNAVVVLKGARTVVAPPHGPAWINPTGTPAMAAAGMGDVLSGVVAAHLARGVPPLEAALLGAYLHGRAGERVAAERGPWGILASEVADAIPAAVNQVLNDDAPADADLTLLIP